MQLNDSLALNWTSTSRANVSSTQISDREQVLIDAFNSYIQIGIGGLLFVAGVTFNCLSLLYFAVSRSFRHTTFRLYFSIIAILDNIRLFEFLVFVLFDKSYLKVTLALCRSVFFTIMFTGQASIWLTVALAIEKCIIIWFPIKGRLCFTMTISKVVLVFVLCLVFFADVIYLSPTFFTYTYENLSIHTFMCVWHRGSDSTSSWYDQWKKHYLTFNTVLFHSIIPSIILLIVNWLILYSLSRHRSDLSKIGSIDAKNVLKREKQFKEKTIQLVLSSFFVIITISPRYILTMVNAFATSLTKTSLMPLYIFVNLNTVFRVLEMCNYSLNIIFAILSGRTSRQEIRKILWECLFWRFNRTPSEHTAVSYPTHTFLFHDDEDDTDRSAHGSGTPHSPHGPRQNNLSPKLSTGTSSFEYSQSSHGASVFTCCGFSIDLSHKNSHSSNGKPFYDDTAARRSTINRNSRHSLAKTSSCPPAKSSSANAQLIRQQKTVCYRLTNNERPVSRRRATTLVRCRRDTPASIKTTLTTTVYPSTCEENRCLSFESTPPPVVDAPLSIKDAFKTDAIASDPLPITSTDANDSILPAYIIETC